MQQPVETPVALQHAGGELVIVPGEGLLEVEQGDARLGAAGAPDFRVHRFELARVAPDEDHIGCAACAGQRDGAANAVAGAGNRDRAAAELIRACNVVSGIKRRAQSGPSSQSQVRRYAPVMARRAARQACHPSVSVW